MTNKSPLKTNKEKEDLVILSSKVKRRGIQLIKLGERYFRIKELG